uniref:Uncharacterized protein n=1 Tax=Anopheles farauti TaxID=69004 RepID=A0A182QSL4_9DIPT
MKDANWEGFVDTFCTNKDFPGDSNLAINIALADRHRTAHNCSGVAQCVHNHRSNCDRSVARHKPANLGAGTVRAPTPRVERVAFARNVRRMIVQWMMMGMVVRMLPRMPRKATLSLGRLYVCKGRCSRRRLILCRQEVVLVVGRLNGRQFGRTVATYERRQRLQRLTVVHRKRSHQTARYHARHDYGTFGWTTLPRTRSGAVRGLVAEAQLLRRRTGRCAAHSLTYRGEELATLKVTGGPLMRGRSDDSLLGDGCDGGGVCCARLCFSLPTIDSMLNPMRGFCVGSAITIADAIEGHGAPH